jgi:hypothetical protein
MNMYDKYKIFLKKGREKNLEGDAEKSWKVEEEEALCE